MGFPSSPLSDCILHYHTIQCSAQSMSTVESRDGIVHLSVFIIIIILHYVIFLRQFQFHICMRAPLLCVWRPSAAASEAAAGRRGPWTGGWGGPSLGRWRYWTGPARTAWAGRWSPSPPRWRGCVSWGRRGCTVARRSGPPGGGCTRCGGAPCGGARVCRRGANACLGCVFSGAPVRTAAGAPGAPDAAALKTIKTHIRFDRLKLNTGRIKTVTLISPLVYHVARRSLFNHGYTSLHEDTSFNHGYTTLHEDTSFNHGYTTLHEDTSFNHGYTTLHEDTSFNHGYTTLHEDTSFNPWVYHITWRHFIQPWVYHLAQRPFF